MATLHGVYGLRIRECNRIGDDASDTHADVIWLRETVASLPAAANDVASGGRATGSWRSDGLWTAHRFWADAVTYCIFDISPDGRRVHSKSIPAMTPDNLEDLFFEAIMRTVLHRLGAFSLHSAALSRDGRAILLMGDKGAGKSTLASALQAEGWSLIADDLVRLEVRDGEWRTTGGRSRLKLWPDSLTATGQSVANAAPRWSGAPPEAMSAAQKLVVSADSKAEASVPVKALCCLMPRGKNQGSIEIDRPPSSLASVLAAEHLTRDSLSPDHPPVSMGKALGDLLSRVPVLRLRLPDALERLPAAARELGNRLG